MISDDAMGIFSSKNDEPLRFRYSGDPSFFFDVVDKSFGSITLRPRIEVTHHVAGYLGAIISKDRNVVFWVNETRPLP